MNILKSNSSISDIMYTIYEDNMILLKHIDIILYKKIKNLSIDIDKGEYKTQYEIKYNNNNFNIYDKKNKKFLYKQSLEQYENSSVKQNYFNSKYNALIKYNSKIYDLKYIKSKNLFNENGAFFKSILEIQKNILQIKKILNFPLVNKQKNLKYISCFIFFGTLLGTHIPKVASKIKAKKYFIIEPNLEIFRLSLFTTDYRQLTKDSYLIFSVEEDRYKRLQDIKHFISLSPLENYLFKYHSTINNYKELYNEFIVSLDDFRGIGYDHNRKLAYIKTAIKNIAKYKLLQKNKKQHNILNKPLFILSPGPSLRDKLPWIKKNKESIIILAYSATLKVLEQYDIVPDIIIAVDEQKIIIKQFPNNKKYLKKLKKSIAILSISINKTLFKFFKKKNIILLESIYKISKNGIPQHSSITVGDSTIHVLLSLRFQNIYLVGTDLALDPKTGLNYDKTHSSSKISNITKSNIKAIQLFDQKNTTIKVKANLENIYVDTTPFFFMILKNYNNIIKNYKNSYDFTIYNLSNGAYIENTIPLRLDNIQNFTKIKNKNRLLKDFYNKNSINIKSDDIDDRIKTNLENMDTINTILKKIKKLNRKKIISYDQLYNSIDNLMLDISKYSSILYSILAEYINIIFNYITYYFNDIQIQEDKKQLNLIKKLVYTQYSSIIQKYINDISYLRYP